MTDKSSGGEPVLYEVSSYGICRALEDSARENCYVRADDYDAVRAQLAAAEKENKKLREDLNAIEQIALVEEQRSAHAESRLAAAEADARRYRWLRDEGDSHFKAFAKRMGYSADALDRHVDAALRSAEGGKDG